MNNRSLCILLVAAASSQLFSKYFETGARSHLNFIMLRFKIMKVQHNLT